MTIKAKEPWLAVLLSYILPGLGQIYAKHSYRGLFFIGLSLISVLGIISWMNFILSPYTKISKLYWSGFIATGLLLAGFRLWSIVDGYISVRKYNNELGIEHSSTKARIGAVTGLLVTIIYIGSYITPVIQYYLNNYSLGISLGESMLPTIENEDITIERVLSGKALQRGNIIAFKSPRDEGDDFCKRIIGLPGDTVEIREKVVFINGQRLFEKYIRHNDALDFSQFTDQYVIPKELKKRDSLSPITIPAGKYFVLGDNRDLSDDSRYFGLVDLRDIRHEIIKICWPPQRSGAV